MAEGPVYDDVNGSLRAGGHHHLCLTVDNVDEAVAHLHRNGVTVIGEPFNVDAINRRLAFFTDPWGNFFELAEAI
ncbi:putative lyase [compost metagenome]